MKNFILLAIFAIVYSEKPTTHGPGGVPPAPEPPFLRGLSKTERCEFFKIFRKENETIAAKKQDIAAWATKYNLTDQVQKFDDDLKAHKAEVSQNVSDVIAALPDIKTQLENIYKNDSQTEKQIHDAVDQLRKANPLEVAALFFIESLFKFEHPIRGHEGKPPGFMGPPHSGGPMPLFPGSGGPPPPGGPKDGNHKGPNNKPSHPYGPSKDEC